MCAVPGGIMRKKTENQGRMQGFAPKNQPPPPLQAVKGHTDRRKRPRRPAAVFFRQNHRLDRGGAFCYTDKKERIGVLNWTNHPSLSDETIHIARRE